MKEPKVQEEAKIGDIILFDSRKKLPAGCIRAHLVESNKSAFRKFIKDLEEDVKSELKNSGKKQYLDTQGKYVETIKIMDKYVEHTNNNPDLYSNSKQSSNALFSNIVECVTEAETNNKIDFTKKFKNSRNFSFPQVTMVSTQVAEHSVNKFIKKLSKFNRETTPDLPETKRNLLGILKNLYEKYPEPNSLSPEELIQIYADVSIYNYNNEIHQKIESDKTISSDIKNQNTQLASVRTNKKLILVQHCFTEEGMANLPEGETKDKILSMIKERDAILEGVQNFTKNATILEDEYFDRMKADLRKFVAQKNEQKLEKINALGKEVTYRDSSTFKNVNGVFETGFAGLKELLNLNPNDSIRSIQTPPSTNSLNNSTASDTLVTIKSDALEAESNPRNIMKGIIEMAMTDVTVEIKDEYYILHFEGKEEEVHAYKISEFNKIFEEKAEKKDQTEDLILSTINELDKMQSGMELKQLDESTKKQIVSKLIVIPEYAENFEPKVYIVPGSENKLIALEHITEPTEILSVRELSENGLEINIEKQLKRKLEKLTVIEEEPAMTEQTYVTLLSNNTEVLEETPIIEHVMFIDQEPEKVMLPKAGNNLNRTKLTAELTADYKAFCTPFDELRSSNQNFNLYEDSSNQKDSRNKNKKVTFNSKATIRHFYKNKNEDEDLEFEPIATYFSHEVLEKLIEAKEQDKSFKNKVKSTYTFIKYKRYDVLKDLLNNNIILKDIAVIENKWYANKKKFLDENGKISKEEFERKEIDYKDKLVRNRRNEFAEYVKQNLITQDPDKIRDVSHFYKKCYESSISERERLIRYRLEDEELEEREAKWAEIMAPIYERIERRAKEEAEKGPTITVFGALLEVGSIVTAHVADEAAKRNAEKPYYSGIPESRGSTDINPPYQSPMYLNSNNTSSTVKSTPTVDSACNTNSTQKTRATWGNPSTGSDYAVNMWSRSSSSMPSLGYASQWGGSKMSVSSWASNASNNSSMSPMFS